ncbi:hypothetical protein QX776_06295 [Alteromonadaceae bacterium BrNp21-10]|nr:hypothetical protein [Alteromonadaceae bacterium BrNp21-10]
MKKLVLAPVFIIACLSHSVLAATEAKEIYLNKDLGFNIEGYKYDQKALPCDVDTFLVEDIVARGEQENLKITTVGTGDSIPNSGAPILAIEITALALGKDKFNFGVRSDKKLPAIKVTAGLITGDKESDTILAKHSCAIMTLQDISPATSNILDLGTYGVSVCDATRKCLKDLSKDIVQWVGPLVQ